MQVEILLYAYGAICLAMVAFNAVYGVVMRSEDSRLDRKGHELRARMDSQIDLIRQGKPAKPSHLRYMERRLSHVNGLLAFDRLLDVLDEESRDPDMDVQSNADVDEHADSDDDARVDAETVAEAQAEYLRQLGPAVLRLARVYRRRDDMQAAYFAYFLHGHGLFFALNPDSVSKILIEYMRRRSLYCRVNAIQALCELCDAAAVAKAVIALDRAGGYVNEKILTEALLSFAGDHSLLTGLLWEKLERVGPRTGLAILNYVRFQSGDYCPQMLKILRNPGEDMELRLSAIRYFGRYRYDPALPFLLDMAKAKDDEHWQYASVAATALGSYKDCKVVDVLQELLHSSNWYVRYNAAVSLDAAGMEYADLAELMEGGDRYAREMMAYRLEEHRLFEAEEANTTS